MRFIRKNAVAELVGWHPVHLMREARAGRFPAPVRIGPNSVGFVESEIQDWMQARIENRLIEPDAEQSVSDESQGSILKPLREDNGSGISNMPKSAESAVLGLKRPQEESPTGGDGAS